ncbi:MAG: hypothetical protein D4R65_02720 [Verrucomicrobiaceae bacterium]|nr:MAG: hypothetical protein D4R65_02720 [Verrucomicrobiaceae bacterium]
MKTYYDILGVPKSASAAEIKTSFLLRSKMMHPDRFNQNRQKAEWELANEMFKELNHAYDVLKNPLSRSQYDSTFGGGFTSKNTYTPPQQTQSQPRQPQYQPASQKKPNSIPLWLIFGIFFALLVLINKGCDAITKKAPASSPSHSSKPIATTRVSPVSADYPEPANGYILKNEMPAGGQGILKITNGCPSHAVVKLVDTVKDSAVYAVFVRGNSEAIIHDIPNGRYRLLFATGRGWDDIDGRFRNREGISAFEEALIFTTEQRRQPDGVYDVSRRMEVTLNPVRTGNAKTDAIKITDFDKY